MENTYKVAILVGNKKEFDDFLREFASELEYIFVNRVEDCIGRRFVGMMIDGTFWERPDASELHRAVITHIK